VTCPREKVAGQGVGKLARLGRRRYKNERTQKGGARLLRVDFAVDDHGFGDAAGLPQRVRGAAFVFWRVGD
jgi:hypothetical protein